MRYGSLFTGIRGLDMAVESVLGARPAWCSEVDPAACRVLDARAPGVPNLGDMTAVDWSAVEPVDLICGGFPCFPAGTLVDTFAGYRPIEEVRVGDRVMTHTRKFRRVTSIMRREASEMVEVKAMGAPALRCTPEHPFYARRRHRVWNNARRQYDQVLGAPEWVEAARLDRGYYLAQPMDEPLAEGIGPRFAHFIGRWLGDGWTLVGPRRSSVPQGHRGSRVNSRVAKTVICCAADEEAEVARLVAACGFHATLSRERTATRFIINSKSLTRFMLQFGRGAHAKRLPGWVFRLPFADQQALLDGWLAADGNVDPRGITEGSTVSRDLAFGLARVARNVRRRGVTVSLSTPPSTTVIEGRVVAQRPQYAIRVASQRQQSTVEDGMCWVPVRSVTPLDEESEVFNISVEGDESYTADSYVVHNCQDISYAGRGAGLDGDRSRLWWEMARAIDVLRPRWVAVENVAALRARGLRAVTHALASMGYVGRYGVVRASDAGACHQRARLFIVAQDATRGVPRAAGRRPQHDSEPLAGGPALPRRRHADRRGDAIADAHDLGRERGGDAWHGRRRPEDGGPRVDFGPYGPAVDRWARVIGRDAPAPVDDRGRLAPEFVEWMMGFPMGHVTGLRHSGKKFARSAMLGLLGRAVVPQQGALALSLLLDGWEWGVAA
jgi:hypothetical protein